MTLDEAVQALKQTRKGVLRPEIHITENGVYLRYSHPYARERIENKKVEAKGEAEVVEWLKRKRQP